MHLCAKHDKIIKEEARNRQKWNIGDPDVQAMKKYLKKADSRDAAPAKTGMTANMIRLLEEQEEEILERILQMITTCGRRPEHWTEMIIILALKPGRDWQNLQEAYRPITLTEILSKAFETALMRLYENALKEHPWHPAVMAYRKGIGAGIAIFTLTETLIQAQEEGYYPVILFIDIKNAYNGSWKKLVEMIEWEEMEFRGQKWSLLKQMTEGISYKARYKGHYTRRLTQQEGFPQGPCSIPKRFNTLMSKMAQLLQEQDVGIMIGDHRIIGTDFSDDFPVVMYHNETKATLKKTGNIMGKLHMQAQLTKLHLTPAFRAGKRFAYKQTQAEAHEEKNARGWEVKSEE